MTTILPSVGQSPEFLQLGPGASALYGAIDLRRALFAGMQEGILGVLGGAYDVTFGGGMNVTIAASSPDGALVQGDSIASQGLYYIPPHSIVLTEAISAAHATLPRIDLVILEILDATHDGGASNLARTRVVAGTATSGATLDNRTGAAALPSSAMLLADVLVPAAAASILAANIRDRRKWANGALNRVERTSSSYTTVSGTTALIDSTNLQPRIECTGVPLTLSLFAKGTHSAAGNSIVLAPYMDGVIISGLTDPRPHHISTSGGSAIIAAVWEMTPVAGSHTFSWGWLTSAATATLSAVTAAPLQMSVREDVRQNVQNS